MIYVVNKKRHPPCGLDIYIGRPSLLGNPFKIRPGMGRLLTIRKYKDWLETQYHLGDDPVTHGAVYKEIRRLVKLYRTGVDIHLACWCAPLPCHGDVISNMVVELAEAAIARDKKRAARS